uniref:General transcription factor IIF subunit 2 n=1 Tax=Daphnia galeata TaxID=27404 RepID=A0A8J2W992_9CRUS|nr:unnamed protein product [Daphnia galeata]
MDSKKKEKEKEKEKDKDVIVYEKEMDMSSASRGVWLVKVPKYISSRWDKCPGNITAGQLNITRVQGQKSQVKLILSEAIMCLQEKGEEPIPKEHGLIVSHITSQTLGVFSQQTTPASANSPMETEKITFEGKVAQKLECRPTANASYMKLKRDCLIKAAQPTRIVKQLDRVVQSYKPISDHKHNKEFEEKKKAEGKKARDDKGKVMDMLFAAFEKHQYYNIKDLVKITNQPVTYLKEILKDVCVYNLKNPHKNMWELKPEYRHYKEEDKD